ncbi:LysR family transcriptional regulator [Candidimonas humi]|uniref:LysR substrate-binding domain-containing protein n=1 Tax=Candidimonas humi TaxID=683355 RepID=A0ABV8P2B8_9BURK|nr:LysR substrate-binding domain-containing protein [Candidimonas humi]MBV6306076.1 LysR family transcriptional regulator [Candidimonas humi]
MELELADLRIFKAVVDEGGVLKAARKLHRVQSSVSARIRQLEASVGTQLFYRDKQRLLITPSGEMLLAYADKLLQLSEEARSAVSGALPSGTLKLGALESTAASRLAPILAAYHRAYPEVGVELVTGTNDTLTAAVAQRQLDAAFVAETPEGGNLCSMALFDEKLVIISAAGHPRITRPEDVKDESLVAFPNGCAYRRALERWIGHGRKPVVRVLELASYHAIVACVAAGAGVALVPESVLGTMQHQGLARHRLPDAHARIVTPLIWRRDESSAALSALREQLRGPRAAAA